MDTQFLYVACGVHDRRCHQGAWDQSGTSFSVCRKQLLSFTSTRAEDDDENSLLEVSQIGQSYEIRYADGARHDSVAIMDWLKDRAVRTTGVRGRQLADACLVRLADAANIDLSASSLAIAHVLRTSIENRRCCPHAVVVEGSICTTLCVEDGSRTALVNIAELFLPRLTVEAELAEASAPLFPVPLELLECGVEEEALPFSTFMALDRWTTTTCRTPPEQLPYRKQKWGHLIFVSHTWRGAGDPGTVADLRQAQRAVAHYAHKVLADKAAGSVSATVKNVSSVDDFGVWVDYMMVPNDAKHMQHWTDGCRRCWDRRGQQIAKISAILTVATCVVVADEQERHKRGWIIHEMTTNTHLNLHDGLLLPDDPGTQLAALDATYLHRVNLMSQTANFTNGMDGRALRLYEFVRLSQLPRTWPAVNEVLLREWRDAGVDDERSVTARDILFKYARHFDQPCHQLKRLMALLPAELALFGVGEHDGSAVDCAPLLAAIEDQRRAMVALGMPSAEDAARLQLQQFVALGMGLRAELLHRAGFTAWLCASQLTAALAASKASARLHAGGVVMFPASCWVSLGEDVPKEAAGGVPAEVLDTAAAQLFVPPRGLRRGRSGKAFVVPSLLERLPCAAM
jgi:hypothetical protein